LGKITAWASDWGEVVSHLCGCRREADVAGHLAIIGYRSLVGGVPSGSLDIQVRWYAHPDPEQVRHQVRTEPLQRYQNPGGDEVCWELVEIFAIEPFAPSESGGELIGFIANVDELRSLV